MEREKEIKKEQLNKTSHNYNLSLEKTNLPPVKRNKEVELEVDAVKKLQKRFFKLYKNLKFSRDFKGKGVKIQNIESLRLQEILKCQADLMSVKDKEIIYYKHINSELLKIFVSRPQNNSFSKVENNNPLENTDDNNIILEVVNSLSKNCDDENIHSNILKIKEYYASDYASVCAIVVTILQMVGKKGDYANKVLKFIAVQ